MFGEMAARVLLRIVDVQIAVRANSFLPLKKWGVNLEHPSASPSMPAATPNLKPHHLHRRSSPAHANHDGRPNTALFHSARGKGSLVDTAQPEAPPPKRRVSQGSIPNSQSPPSCFGPRRANWCQATHISSLITQLQGSRKSYLSTVRPPVSRLPAAASSSARYQIGRAHV